MRKVGLMEAGDAQLVRSVLDGDRAAYAELYERYARWVRAVCFDTARNLSDAQDLTQEVFLRAYAQLGRLREPERFGAWLHSIARNRCLEWLRAQSYRRCESLPAHPSMWWAGGAEPEMRKTHT